MNSQKLTLTNKSGQELSAVLELPVNQKVQNYALFAHCFTCGKDLGIVRHVSRELTQYGFGVMRFDFTGLGHSGGEFAETSFTSNIEDLITVSEYLEQNYKAPSLIIGHSLGGSAAIIAASLLDHIKAVVSISAPSEIAHVTHLFDGVINQVNEVGMADVFIGGRKLTVSKQMINDFAKHNLMAVVSKLRKPILIFHSPQDEIVEVEHAAKIYHKAKHPKSFISIDGANHLISDSFDARYVGSLIGSWAQRYIIKEKEKQLALEDQQVAAVLNLENKFTTQIGTRRHALIADEPKSFGGDDLGASPYELLLAGLGACSVMTMKLYAERKNWPLREAKAYLSFNRVHSDDVDFDTDKMGQIQLITKKIEVEGDLTEEQKAKLIKIASRCPVHKTLQDELIIHTEALTPHKDEV